MSGGEDHEPCSLCGTAPEKTLSSKGRKLYHCGNCGLVYVETSARPSPEESRKRYLLHENGIEHAGYCDFLNRAVHAAAPFLTTGSRGLDFGCGPSPTLSKLLEAEGFLMTDYDPLFFDQPLAPSYDFIFSTECFEHFEAPKQDIARVTSRLRPGGVLTIMTELWDNGTDFEKWYYAADPTHISFYSTETLAFICKVFRFQPIAGDGKRVFTFLKI